MEQKYIDRFWSKVSKVPDANGCLNWTASHMKTGYGAFGEYKKVHGAHRLAWQLTNGAIAPGIQVCHSCDNPSCCNVGHLFLGTAKDNAADRVRKGRDQLGSQRPNAKITEKDVWVILSLRNWSGFTGAAIAAEYGINQTHVSAITRRKQWRHVKWP